MNTTSLKVKKLKRLLYSAIIIITGVSAGCGGKENRNVSQLETSSTSADSNAIFNFKMPVFGSSHEDSLAAYGQKLVNETYQYFNKDGKKIQNSMTCSNCHLHGGTKPYGIPFIGLTNVFPTYIGRENKIVSLQDRINGCFERSMNGEAISEDSKEMKAIISYIGFLSRNINNKGRLKGHGTLALTPPDRKADVAHGKVIYQNKCQSCHRPGGQGMKLPDSTGYQFPPLWGPDSFNDGAGMDRILTAARFIKGNMPFGTVYKNPNLTDEEAYDVAAYIDHFNRPVKAHKELDYPRLSKKPKDCPYPPYNDTISQEQHKFGPFNF